jgi:hypothetical protein
MLRRQLGLRTMMRKERASLWCRRNPSIRTKGITCPLSTSMQRLLTSRRRI